MEQFLKIAQKLFLRDPGLLDDAREIPFFNLALMAVDGYEAPMAANKTFPLLVGALALLLEFKPQSLQSLSDVIALLRP